LGGVEVNGALKFDEGTHRYSLDGVPLLSVTQTLKGAGLVEYDNLPIARDVLEHARQRGKAVHSACHFLDEDDLELTSLDPEIDGYVRAWEKFKQESGVTFSEIEVRHNHPIYKYAGTPDRLGLRQMRKGVYDIKTYECAPWTALQLSGYEMMVRPETEAPLERWGIWLKKDGTYKANQFSDKNDGQVFLACLTVASWKINHGGKI
jgi:hypothetical protein